MDIVYYKGWNKLKGNISASEVLKQKNNNKSHCFKNKQMVKVC
jgi:hypothetical protein